MKITLCLEDIRSVYNIGSIFRTAEGFGLNNFALIGISPTPIDKNGNKRRDFIKTALGAEDKITWQYFENSQKLIDTLSVNKDKIKIISLEITQKSEDISGIKDYLNQIIETDKQSNQNTNILIFIGSEVSGVSQSILDISDKTYHINMFGDKESFNVAVACGIMMYLIKN